MKVFKTSDAMPINSVLGMIYGEPGVGKTTLACSADRALLLDFDKGANIPFRGDTVAVSSWEEVENEVMEYVQANNYKTVIWDTVDTAREYLKEYLLELDKQNNHKERYNRDPRRLAVGMQDKMLPLINKYKRSGINLILLAHVEEKEVNEITQKRPMLSGKLGREMMNKCDYIANLAWVNKTRILTFNPSDSAYAKNRGNLEDYAISDFVPGQKNNDMAIMIGMILKNMNSFHESHLDIENQVGVLKLEIDQLTEDTFNDWYINDFAELERTGEKMVFEPIKRYLSGRAKELGMKYDKTTKEFIKNVETKTEDSGT